nr:8376_t:CDS:2 [Entrophospora candida]
MVLFDYETRTRTIEKLKELYLELKYVKEQDRQSSCISSSSQATKVSPFFESIFGNLNDEESELSEIIYEKNIVVVIDQEVTKFQSPDGYSIREWKLTIYAINDVGAKTQTPNRYKIDDSPNYESSSRSSYSSTDSAYDKENCLIDYTRLANNLSSLEGNDILEVIDLITRNRTNDMYINDDIDGEFHMDLYSLGEDLLKVLWDFTESRLSGRDP